MRSSLKKSEILREKKEISRLFDNGEWNKGHFVNIVSLPADNCRVLFAIARHLKGAVLRNRGKRYLRECYRNNKDWFSSLYIYGLILKKMPKYEPLKAIREDLQALLQDD
ncbi:MAG: ribonuclease P protein component [Candidatus Marinimicrobia bacterium]|nr:ribonuclease P protein component [Candidatus Neomarinimicrobiota bacterium]